MDFGLVGFEGLVPGCPNTEHNPPKSNGSGSIKQERSDPFEDEVNRFSKTAKRGDDLRVRSNDTTLPKHQMLSFSSYCSNKQEPNYLYAKDVGLISDKNAQNLALSFFQQSAYSRNPTGFGSGNLNGGMQGSFTGIRGPFTPVQWIELEHQAMIYKYFTANVPVPANLLTPIRKALSSAAFPGFSVGSYPAHSYGWGSFHLGFSSSTDPEPGRCRRTDGKKWRCSRDAVPDQKYCERHINRGRHRSRKPVEGHTGQATSGPPTTTTMMKVVSSSTSPSPSSGTVSATMQHQIKGLHPAIATTAATNPIVNRLLDQQGLSVTNPSINLKLKDSSFSVAKQLMLVEESPHSEFGLVSADSLLNPSDKTSYLDCKTYNSFPEFNSQQHQNDYPLRHFMDDWSSNQSNRSSIPWHEELKSDWTQLSMSIPMSSGFSSTASPNHEKVSISPLRLTHEVDPSQMGLGFGTIIGETRTHNSQLLTAWSNSIGGPLGEVLNNNNNASNVVETSKCMSALNLKGGEMWDGSPQLGASPTGVLQKSTFVSLSNSSSGSPRGDKATTQERAQLCEDLLVSAAHASSSSIPSM